MTVPEFSLNLVPTSLEAAAARGFRWADDKVGKRSKIGGMPDFLQMAHAPSCPSCDEAMTFFAQLDSVGDEVCFADVGMLYTFVCFGCYETISFIQSS